MRPMLALGLLLATVSAAPAQPVPPPPDGANRAFRERQERMEDKSKASLVDQEARNARFDENVRRATGSVCRGCFAEPERSGSRSRRKPVTPPEDADE